MALFSAPLEHEHHRLPGARISAGYRGGGIPVVRQQKACSRDDKDLAQLLASRLGADLLAIPPAQ